jgi:hypothetical protein
MRRKASLPSHFRDPLVAEKRSLRVTLWRYWLNYYSHSFRHGNANHSSRQTPAAQQFLKADRCKGIKSAETYMPATFVPNSISKMTKTSPAANAAGLVLNRVIVNGF